MNVKRNYVKGDFVTLKGGDGEVFRVIMNSAVGVALCDATGSNLPYPFPCDQLIPFCTKNS